MTRYEQIRRDLSRKLQQELSDTLERNLNVAAVELAVPQVMMLLVEAAVMMCRTTAATMANSLEAADDHEIRSVYNATIDAIVDEVGQSRADGIARTIAAVSARRAAA